MIRATHVCQHCLEAFFTTKGERGTGLGLALVYSIMQRHEGDVEIESKLGEGTTVRLVFAQRHSAVAAGVAEEDAPPVPNLRILTIDDAPLLSELFKQMLEADGNTVTIADGGQSGVAAFNAANARGEAFDVVITDLGMPQLNGRQVAQAIKNESPQTPVILLTGWGSQLNERDIPTEVDLVLGKPPKLSELRKALAKVTKKAA
jgi:CheY-like chemotaxis protein